MQSLYALHFCFISHRVTTSFTPTGYYTLIIGGETVKKFISLAAAALLVFFLSTCARRPEEPEPDYLGMMMQAAQQGDVETGRQAQQLWETSLAKKKGEEQALSFDQLYLLSRLIHFKYGHYRYSDELRMCAGEVILNRMASPEYPDTMEKEIFQKGIEDEVDEAAFSLCVSPSRNCVRAAARLLQGERMLEPEVVLETHYPSKGIYAVFCDDLLGNTYFYKSEHPELYKAGND